MNELTPLRDDGVPPHKSHDQQGFRPAAPVKRTAGRKTLAFVVLLLLAGALGYGFWQHYRLHAEVIATAGARRDFVPTVRTAAVRVSESVRLATWPGATEAFDPGDLASGGVDLVVEASGTAQGLDLAADLVAEHGTLSILGYHQGRRGVDMSTWNWKALDVINAHVRDGRLLARATDAALRLLAAGRLEMSPLLTHHFPLERAAEAYEALETKPEGFHKAVITL